MKSRTRATVAGAFFLLLLTALVSGLATDVWKAISRTASPSNAEVSSAPVPKKKPQARRRSARVKTDGASVVTDKDSYGQGETVLITGSGFQPGESVALQVLHVGDPADNDSSTAHLPWLVP